MRDSRTPSDCFRSIEAVSVLQKTYQINRGAVVRAPDGHFYIMKYRQFTIEQTLLNEFIGAQLFQLVGLAIPDWRTVAIPVLQF
jgi:hypothetical protein